MTYEEMMALYPPDLFPWLYDANAPYPDFFNEPVPDLMPSPEPEFTPEPEPVVSDMPGSDQAPAASEPIEVISVDDLLNRLLQDEQAAEESGELVEGDLSEALEDIPVVEPDPMSLILDQVLGKLVDVVIDLGEIKKDTGKIQENTAAVAQTLDHPALTTSFADYTVTEALLLFLFLSAFIAACARMLKGGLSWLRS